MFEIDGKNYELKYTLKRIEMIENATKKPMMRVLSEGGGMLSVSELKYYLAYALRLQGADSNMDTAAGFKLVDELLEKCSYIELCGATLEALQRDCPFFFRAD